MAKDLEWISQGERGKTYSLDLYGIQIVVTKYSHVPWPWFLICTDLGIDLLDLGTNDPKEAQTNALQKVYSTLKQRIDELQKAKDTIGPHLGID